MNLPPVAETPGAAAARVGVVVVDDDPLVCSALTMILQADPAIEVLAMAHDGQEAVRVVASTRPAVVLMDVAMPGAMDGVDATAAINAQPSPPTVVILTSVNDSDLVPRALRAGAFGFVLKDSAPSALAGAVLLAARGIAPISPTSLQQLAAADGARQRQEARERLRPLTDRERESVTGLVRGRTNAEIAAEMYVSDSTVKTHLASAMLKLGCANRTELAVIAGMAGLGED